MTLNYSSPAAFAAAIRLRRNKLGPDVTLVIVEGASDTKTFQHFAHPEARSVPARGKEMVLKAYEELRAEGESMSLWIVDCDGEVDARWLGKPGLLVSTNRDVDADLVIELGSLQRAGREFLGSLYETTSELDSAASDHATFAIQFASLFGSLLGIARAAGLTVKVYDPKLMKRRPLLPSDLAETSTQWASRLNLPTIEALLVALSRQLVWDTDLAQLANEFDARGGKLCRKHQSGNCLSCMARRHANGHYILDSLSVSYSSSAGFHISPAEVARASRIAAQADAIEGWELIARVRLWEASTGGRAIA